MLAFDIDSYNDFCEKNNYKPGYYQSLLKFESFCRSYGINTRPLKQKWQCHFSISMAFLLKGEKDGT